MTALDFIDSADKALILFTRGWGFVVDKEGDGYLRGWVLRPDDDIDFAVIYYRTPLSKLNAVFVADVVGFVENEASPGRYDVQLRNVRFKRFVQEHWHDFAQTQKNPVRLHRKSKPMDQTLQETNIMRARALLAPGESALVVYTTGNDFVDNGDGTGSTGWWRILVDDGLTDLVVIYNRLDNQQTEVYTARPVSADGPVNHRYRVNLQDVKLMGKTEANWFDFAETGPQPVRYLYRVLGED